MIGIIWLSTEYRAAITATMFCLMEGVNNPMLLTQDPRYAEEEHPHLLGSFKLRAQLNFVPLSSYLFPEELEKVGVQSRGLAGRACPNEPPVRDRFNDDRSSQGGCLADPLRSVPGEGYRRPAEKKNAKPPPPRHRQANPPQFPPQAVPRRPLARVRCSPPQSGSVEVPPEWSTYSYYAKVPAPRSPRNPLGHEMLLERQSSIAGGVVNFVGQGGMAVAPRPTH
ncbi:hypothetical protein CIRG_06568 [Coccidioides immitis RMSCC 2394]|uniref:Uncharacterized protein n=1 Tax=Coccidioides immitis RMSCC 2394 TaxID=404692 RepID=A0A0J7BA25_COCIT|nr:hypothetical protein CIRG_06568 [Coccidioides immitis RMSCC 2394]